MLSPPLRTATTGTPMQSAANRLTANAEAQQKLNNAVTGGKRRRRGGKAIPTPVLTTPYPTNSVPGPGEIQLGTQQVGEKMGVQAQGDQVPLVTGGKKSRKSRKTKKSRKSKKSKKSKKSRKSRK